MNATETLERRIDELCAENERLRSCLSDDADNAREIMAENKRLRQENQSIGMAAYELGRVCLTDENAKLRELVRDMWLQLLNAYDRKEVDEFADRMRELGILNREA